MRDARSVIHSHGMESCLVTMLDPLSKEFWISHMEMIKGIKGHGYYDELVVPIIENFAHERDLTESLAKVAEAKFGYLLEALNMGAPPDGTKPSSANVDFQFDLSMYQESALEQLQNR